MGWSTAVIYTIPNDNIIRYFKNIESLNRRVFNVTDLKGITSEWTQNLFNLQKEQAHSLPANGLLAVAPSVNRTSYNNEDLQDSFYKDNAKDVNKFVALPDLDISDDNLTLISEKIGLAEDELLLVKNLIFLNKETSLPLCYYRCEMWGGTVEIEYTIVADISRIYAYVMNEDTSKTENLITNKIMNQDSLQLGLSHLGLDLPTSFFALHETSFNWKPYQV